MEKYNLTTPQSNIWAVEEFNEKTNINNVFGIFKINKKLDVEILKKAINKVIELNDALRIRIVMEDDKPKQYITTYEFYEVKTYLVEKESDAVDKIIKEISKERFNIINNNLFDMRLISGDSFTIFLIKTHHLISDAWSIGQISEQIKRNYNKIKKSEKLEVQPSYLQFIKKDEEYKFSDRYLLDKEYWSNYVKEFNCDNIFEVTKDIKSRRIEKKLDNELFERILAFCKENGIQEFPFLFSIISIYFSKIYNKKNMVFGTPFINRRKANKEFEMLGMFVSTLPINVSFSNEKSFLDICREIGRVSIHCFKHSKFPFTEIEQLYRDFTKSNTRLFEIVFSYQINKLEEEIDGSLGETTWIVNNTQANPLLISFVNHFGEHTLYYDYLLNCFSEKDIDQIHERILHIINQVLENGDVNYNDLDILSDDDIKKIIKFNITGNATRSEDTIISRFNKNMIKSKNAVIYGDQTITYKELDEKSDYVCNEILKRGIKNNKPISVILDKSIDLIIAILGVIKSGNYYIPILPEEANDRLEYIINDSGSKMVISNSKYLKVKTFISEELEKFNIEKLTPNIKKQDVLIKKDDICYVIYTSGTTGKPKGVEIKHENIISLIDSMNLDEDLKYLKNDIAISLLKHSFDASAIDMYSSLLNGGKLVLVEKEDELNPEKVVEIIKKEKVTRVFTVHKWIEKIQTISIEKNVKLESLRIIGTGAEVLKPKQFERLLEKNPNISIYNTYGPTEATMFITKHKVSRDDLKLNYSPIGKLMPCYRAIVINDKNELLPPDAHGELLIYNDNKSLLNIAKGYYGKPKLSKEKFIFFKNPINNQVCRGYKTGDVVKINNSLELEFLGRRDDFVKVSGGYLVSLNEVEQRLIEILNVDIEIATITIPIKDSNVIILFISKKGQAKNIKNDDIKNLIETNMTFYMKPKHVIEVENMPRTQNGKVDKRELEKIAKNYLKKSNIIIKPQTALEQVIYDKIKNITKEDFSVTDDFEEDLGLDSLDMTNLFIELDNRNMKLQDLYNYSSVRELANMMSTENLSELKNEKRCNVKVVNKSKPMNLEKVLLTGVTGFVGINMLKELVECKEIKQIYCIVRTKVKLTSEERFEKAISTYFDEEICKKIRKKVKVLNGNLVDSRLGLSDEEFKSIIPNLGTIVNCAANVKHVGKYKNFYRDNVKTVINLINICEKYNISLAHTSTLSLNGFRNTEKEKIFNENVLNLNQSLNRSPYLISKYEAEERVLNEVSRGKLNAKIFRLGNIMPRKSDGVFQENYEQNAFLMAINEIKKLKLQTIELMNTEIYLTPVDECVSAIVTILKNKTKNTIYHIESDKGVKIYDFIKLFNSSINIVEAEELKEKLYKDYNIGVEHLNDIFSNNANKYSNSITQDILKSLDFNWGKQDEKYLKSILKVISKM